MIKLGNAIATVATPIARAIGMDCIDPETQQLRPESRCNKRIVGLNNFGDKFYDYFFHPEKRKPEETMKFILQMQVSVDADKAEDVLTKAKPQGGELISFSVNPRPTPQLMQRPPMPQGGVPQSRPR